MVASSAEKLGSPLWAAGNRYAMFRRFCRVWQVASQTGGRPAGQVHRKRGETAGLSQMSTFLVARRDKSAQNQPYRKWSVRSEELRVSAGGRRVDIKYEHSGIACRPITAR